MCTRDAKVVTIDIVVVARLVLVFFSRRNKRCIKVATSGIVVSIEDVVFSGDVVIVVVVNE